MRERERERERDQPSDDMHNDSIWNFCSKNIHIFFRQRAREKAIRIFTSVKCSKNRSEKKTYTHKVAYEFTGEGAETRTMYADLNRSNANTEINKSERECGERKRQAHSNRIRSSDIHWYILFEMSFVLQKHTHTLLRTEQIQWKVSNRRRRRFFFFFLFFVPNVKGKNQTLCIF